MVPRPGGIAPPAREPSRFFDGRRLGNRLLLAGNWNENCSFDWSLLEKGARHSLSVPVWNARDGMRSQMTAATSETSMTDQRAPSQSLPAKLANLLRSRGVASTAQHVRTVLLHRAHAAWDKRNGSRAADWTANKVELAELDIKSPNRSAGVHYLPTPWSVLEWMHEALPEAKPQWSFVDLGAGKGRTLLSAARRPYGRVIGVEFASELVEVAQKNVAMDRSLVAESVEVAHCDTASYDLPKSPLVVFMFNPFGLPVIECVAAAIERSYAETPRPIIVAYLNPAHHQVFDAMEHLQEAKLPWPLATKFRFFSPYHLSLYATPEALQK